MSGITHVCSFNGKPKATACHLYQFNLRSSVDNRFGRPVLVFYANSEATRVQVARSRLRLAVKRRGHATAHLEFVEPLAPIHAAREAARSSKASQASVTMGIEIPHIASLAALRRWRLEPAW